MADKEVRRKIISERLLSDARERLSIPAVQDALGMRGVALSEALDMAYIPDTTEGYISDIGEDDQFPVVVLKANETMTSSAVQMTAFQREQTARLLLKSHGEPASYDDVMPLVSKFSRLSVETACWSMQEFGRDRTGSYGYHTTAHGYFMEPNSDSLLLTRGRPHVFIRWLRESRVGTHVMADTLTHEISHALDSLATPIAWFEQSGDVMRAKLSSELAAYATEIVIAGVLRGQRRWWHPTVPYGVTSARVEALRRRINGSYTSPGAFDPNDHIIEALRENGLEFIYAGS